MCKGKHVIKVSKGCFGFSNAFYFFIFLFTGFHEKNVAISLPIYIYVCIYMCIYV